MILGNALPAAPAPLSQRSWLYLVPVLETSREVEGKDDGVVCVEISRCPSSATGCSCFTVRVGSREEIS